MRGMSIINPVDGSPFGPRKYVPAVSDGQTVFTLPSAPDDAPEVTMLINTVLYDQPTYLLVSGQTVTWGNAFPLTSTDEVTIYY